MNPARLAEIRKIFEQAASSADASQFFLTTHSAEFLDLFDAVPNVTRLRSEQTSQGSSYRTAAELPLFTNVERRLSLADVPPTRSLGTRVARGDFG